MRKLTDHGLVMQDVSFRYGRSGPLVLDAFNWDVPPGRTVLLGPNGAGKTTILAIAANALTPRRGTLRLGQLVAGRRRDRAAYRRAVGWMPQQVRSVPGLTCREQVAYAGWLKGMSTSEAWAAAMRPLEQVGMLEAESRLTSALSGGQLRRIGLAQVLVHTADVLLLDEPTVGLDPAQRAAFRDILRGLPDDVPVVVSTHQVDDLTELFDTVVVLDGGVIRHQSSVADFMNLAPSTSERRAELAYQQLVSGNN